MSELYTMVRGIKYGRLLTGLGASFLLLLILPRLVQNLDASHLMVVQYPSGKMDMHTTPGWKWQGFGKVTEYKKRHQYDFVYDSSDAKRDQSLPTRFNDGGKAKISGSVAWEMPTSPEELFQVHSKYGSDEAVAQQLIGTVVAKSVSMTGPLMSSTESYAARRNDLVSLILDQIQHGVYRTTVRQEKVKDEMSGVEKTVSIVNLMPSTAPGDHGFLRQEQSPLDEFALRTFNLTINDVIYDEQVTSQIKQQQDAIMTVQTAMANAKKAEQAAITAEKNGEAEAAKAKWEQEVIKAQKVTEAEQEREVARLMAEAAEFGKKKAILEGEGEARKRELIMNADGALALKLEAWKFAQEKYADAIMNYNGAWVPGIVMGGTSTLAGNGALNLVDLLTAKTARELNLDLGTVPPRKQQQQQQAPKAKGK